MLDRANQLLPGLEAGEDFAGFGQGIFPRIPFPPSLGGDLGWNERGVFVPEFEEALFGLEEVGQYTAPVQTQFGYHIIRLDGLRGGDIAPFEDAREDVLADLGERRSRTRFYDLADRLADMGARER